MFEWLTNFFRTSSPAPEQRSVSSSLENPNQWLTDLLTGGTTLAGATVNDRTALSISAVYACAKVLSESVASLPISLYRKNGDIIEVAQNRYEHFLISEEPSSLTTSYNFRSALMLHTSLRGNFYAFIERDGRGGAKALKIAPVGCVSPFMHKGQLFYRVFPNSDYGIDEMKVLMPYEVLHIANMSRDGIVGVSPITELRESMAMDMANRDNAAKIMKRGRVDGVLQSPNKLTLEEGKSLKSQFSERVAAGEFPVLQNGLEFRSIALTPADAEFIRTAQLTRQQIAAAYRVPLHMINDLERATFSNIEHQSLEFVKFTLLPWLKNIEAEFNRKLLPRELRSTHFFRFNVEGLLRGDLKSRIEAHTKAVQWGLMNRDEVRAIENLNPIPGGLGQEFITPLNMQLLADSGNANADAQNDNGTQPSTSATQ